MTVSTGSTSMMTPAVVRFTLTQPDGRVAVLRFAKALIRIGRALDNDVVCEAPEVSARHAELHVVDRRLTLVDLGSRQGLWLGPTRLPAGLGVDFTAGSTVQLGPLRLCIELDDEGGMTTASTERERRLRDGTELLSAERALAVELRVIGGPRLGASFVVGPSPFIIGASVDAHLALDGAAFPEVEAVLVVEGLSGALVLQQHGQTHVLVPGLPFTVGPLLLVVDPPPRRGRTVPEVLNDPVKASGLVPLALGLALAVAIWAVSRLLGAELP